MTPHEPAAGRVIAGTARGHRLGAPPDGVRPMGDRVKQTLFAILEPVIRDRAFLDLFAGSGAGGIEALSRGAERAVFVERDREAVRSVERNLSATHLAGSAIVVQADARVWLRDRRNPPGPYAAILLDPPYDQAALLLESLEAIEAAGPGGLLAADGVVVSKHFWRQGPPARIGLLASVRERRFGETGLTFHRWSTVGHELNEEAG
jgi:16S rRNA (guanine966-N2)-methyltransferase